MVTYGCVFWVASEDGILGEPQHEVDLYGSRQVYKKRRGNDFGS